MDESGSMSGRLQKTERLFSVLLAATYVVNGCPDAQFSSSSIIRSSMGVGLAMTVTVTPSETSCQLPSIIASSV